MPDPNFLGLSITAWTALAAFAACCTFVVAVVAAWIGLSQIKQARDLRQQEARPYVVVDFDVDWLTYLTIKNIGATAARNVRFSFDPSLASTLHPGTPIDESWAALKRGIPLLPPGKELRSLFDAINARFSDPDLPRRFTMTVTYDGPAEAPGPFSDPYELDLSIYEGTPPKPPAIPEIVKVLTEMQRTIKSWTYSLDGVRVYGVDAQAHEARRRQLVESRSDSPQKATKSPRKATTPRRSR